MQIHTVFHLHHTHFFLLIIINEFYFLYFYGKIIGSLNTSYTIFITIEIQFISNRLYYFILFLVVLSWLVSYQEYPK